VLHVVEILDLRAPRRLPGRVHRRGGSQPRPPAADIDHTVAAALPISGLTETAAAFARHRRSPGKTIIQVAHDLEGNERS